MWCNEITTTRGHFHFLKPFSGEMFCKIKANTPVDRGVGTVKGVEEVVNDEEEEDGEE